MGFWLFDLLDEAGIKNQDQLAVALRGGAFTRTIVEHAEAQGTYSLAPLESVGQPILAAHGLDMSGTLGCFNPECINRDFDRLVSRTWFYFDQIAIVGASKRMIKSFMQRNDAEATAGYIGSLLENLQYIRDVGAEDYVVFTEKAPACQQHYKQHLEENGLHHILNGSHGMIEKFVAEGTFSKSGEHGDHDQYMFHHPMLEHSKWVCAPKLSDGNEGDVAIAVAEQVLAEFASHLTSDVISARMLGIPLGLGTAVNEVLVSSPASVANTAFALDLPILTDINPRDAMKIRKGEAGSFERFRAALTQAMSDLIASNEDETADGIAAQIIDDVIGPALADIDDKMEKSKALLNRKSATSIGSGVVLTMAGALISAPILFPVGAALWGVSTLQSVHKHWDEARDIKLSDMYFLWSREVQARKPRNRLR